MFTVLRVYDVTYSSGEAVRFSEMPVSFYRNTLLQAPEVIILLGSKIYSATERQSPLE